jgi:hypothetical protein
MRGLLQLRVWWLLLGVLLLLLLLLLLRVLRVLLRGRLARD